MTRSLSEAEAGYVGSINLAYNDKLITSDQQAAFLSAVNQGNFDPYNQWVWGRIAAKKAAGVGDAFIVDNDLIRMNMADLIYSYDWSTPTSGNFDPNDLTSQGINIAYGGSSGGGTSTSYQYSQSSYLGSRDVETLKQLSDAFATGATSGTQISIDPYDATSLPATEASSLVYSRQNLDAITYLVIHGHADVAAALPSYQAVWPSFNDQLMEFTTPPMLNIAAGKPATGPPAPPPAKTPFNMYVIGGLAALAAAVWYVKYRDTAG
jgi:hypothetical protein